MTPRDLLPYLEYTPKSGKVRRIYADAWESEEFKSPAEATEHAVETGSIVSDHYRVGQKTCNVRLFFSEAPIRGDLDPTRKGEIVSVPIPKLDYPKLTPLISPGGVTKLAGEGIGAALNAVGLGPAAGPSAYKVLQFPDGPPGRLREVLTTLTGLQDDAILITLGLSVLRVPNLAILEVAIARTSSDGDSGSIDLSVRQLSFVSTKSAAALPLPLEPRGQQKKDSVTVGAAPVPPGPKRTAAQAVVDAF